MGERVIEREREQGREGERDRERERERARERGRERERESESNVGRRGLRRSLITLPLAPFCSGLIYSSEQMKNDKKKNISTSGDNTSAVYNTARSTQRHAAED